MTVLHKAIKTGLIENVQTLIDSGANVRSHRSVKGVSFAYGT
jgi:hypothetical protein